MTAETTVQGVLVLINGIGVLICGPAGSGKSHAALRLMQRGFRLVADDLVHVSRTGDGGLLGRPLEHDVRIEVRGLGLYRAQDLFPDATAPDAPIRLVAELDTFDPAKDLGRTEPKRRYIDVLGCRVPAVRVPVAQGCDSALLIEILARVFAPKEGCTCD